MPEVVELCQKLISLFMLLATKLLPHLLLLLLGQVLAHLIWRLPALQD